MARMPAVQSFVVTPICNVAVFISYTLFFKESTGIIHNSVTPFFEFFYCSCALLESE